MHDNRYGQELGEPQGSSPTIPINLPIELRGFESEEIAFKVANYFRAYLTSISKHIDISDLVGIIIATNYDDALASLDRGFETNNTLTRTDTTELQGFAMAPLVKRNGFIKSYLVFDAAVVIPLTLEETDSKICSICVNAIAHEAAHIELNSIIEKNMPGLLLNTKLENYYDALLHPVAESFLSEYGACRIAAKISPDYTNIYLDTLTEPLKVAREKVVISKSHYRIHGDIPKLLQEVGGAILMPLKSASYLLGHLDGLELSIEDFPKIKNMLIENGYFELFLCLHEELKSLWVSKSEWRDISVWNNLKTIACDAFASAGLFISRRVDGSIYVDVP